MSEEPKTRNDESELDSLRSTTPSIDQELSPETTASDFASLLNKKDLTLEGIDWLVRPRFKEANLLSVLESSKPLIGYVAARIQTGDIAYGFLQAIAHPKSTRLSPGVTPGIENAVSVEKKMRSELATLAGVVAVRFALTQGIAHGLYHSWGLTELRQLLDYGAVVAESLQKIGLTAADIDSNFFKSSLEKIDALIILQKKQAKSKELDAVLAQIPKDYSLQKFVKNIVDFQNHSVSKAA